MTFSQKLENLPLRTRQILMAICVTISSLAIFLFWAHSLKNTTFQNSQNESITQQDGQNGIMPSLKQTVGSSLADIISLFKTGKQKVQDSFKSEQNIEINNQNSNPENSNQSNNGLPGITPHQLP